MRAYLWFVGAIVLAGVLAACVAYPAFELTRPFAQFAFHRVASRIAMLLLILELVVVCRQLHLTRRGDFGYGLPWRRFIGRACSWGLIGVLTAALGAGFLLVAGLRVRDPQFVISAGSLVRIFLTGLSSGIAVALLEETTIRGLMHTAVEREAGPWAAALLTAPLFAVLHFFARVRIPADQVSWSSGFVLLSQSFAPLAHFGAVFDAFLSWVIVGLILSMTRILTGNIAIALGLHAGWVIVLRMLQQSTISGGSAAGSMWVGRTDGLLGYWMVPWGVAIGALLWLTRARWAATPEG